MNDVELTEQHRTAIWRILQRWLGVNPLELNATERERHESYAKELISVYSGEIEQELTSTLDRCESLEEELDSIKKQSNSITEEVV